MSERLSSSAAQHTSEEIFPAISVDIAYGKYVDDFEVNTDRITQYLRDGGLDDDQISEISIRFSAEPPKRKGDQVTVGNYRKKDRRITISHGEEIATAHYVFNDERSAEVNDATRDTLVHELEHAVAHHDPEQKAINRKYQRGILLSEFKHGLIHNRMAGAIALGLALENFTDMPHAFGISMIVGSAAQMYQNHRDSKYHAPTRHREQYLNNPEEIRAREAASEASADILALTIKDPMEETRAQLEEARHNLAKMQRLARD